MTFGGNYLNLWIKVKKMEAEHLNAIAGQLQGLTQRGQDLRGYL